MGLKCALATPRQLKGTSGSTASALLEASNIFVKLVKHRQYSYKSVHRPAPEYGTDHPLIHTTTLDKRSGGTNLLSRTFQLKLIGTIFLSLAGRVFLEIGSRSPRKDGDCIPRRDVIYRRNCLRPLFPPSETTLFRQGACSLYRIEKAFS